MKYVGLLRQQSANNAKSLLLLILFPVLLLGITWVVCAGMSFSSPDEYDPYYSYSVSEAFFQFAPIVLVATGIWFLIAYSYHSKMIANATKAKPLERRDNMHIYNLVENLCMAVDMDMPKVYVINSSALNAYASGINNKSYTVTLTQGIIDKLSTEELEGVIAHELTHIRNRDVRLLVVSIIFVGIFSFIAQVAMRSLQFGVGGARSSNKKGGGNGMFLLIVLVAVIIGYFFSTLLRFAISRKREFMADAGGAQMTSNPLALASALRKISGDSKIASMTNEDVAQLFIEHPIQKKKGGISTLFATHPPILERIRVLEQF